MGKVLVSVLDSYIFFHNLSSELVFYSTQFGEDGDLEDEKSVWYAIQQPSLTVLAVND